jgi:hypothetical protein
MPIIATASGGSNGTFTPHPEGQYVAVCVDVYDMGLVEVKWQGTTKKQHKIEIYFFCDQWTEPDGEGKRHPMLARERFTLSLSEKGNLRPFLESWRGQAFTEQELAGFDVEKLIGAPAIINILHNRSGENVYANVKTAMKLMKGMSAPKVPADFKRRHVREAEKAAENGPATQQQNAGPSPFDADDDDLPF